MKPEDINLDTTCGELDEALARGDFTIADWVAQVPRVRAEAEARELGREIAIDAVKKFEARKRPRTGRWTSRYVIGGDGSRFYLVTCWRASWHVDPKTFEVIRRVH